MNARLGWLGEKVGPVQWAGLVLCLCAAGPSGLRAEPLPAVELTRDVATGALVFHLRDEAGRVLTLEGSPPAQFGEWVPVWAGRGGAGEFEIDGGEAGATRFFRLRTNPPPEVAPDARWKTGVALPGDPFLSEPLGGIDPDPFASPDVRWVKFSVLLDDLSTVYFQKSDSYPFHYEFGRDFLPGLLGLDRGAFDAATLFRGGQVALLGAVLFNGLADEFAVQVVGIDPVPPELLAFVFGRVSDSLQVGEGARGFYFPTFEQAGAAEAGREFFAARGIELGSVGRWVTSDQCYSEGWAVGRLVYVAGGAVAQAYREGTLLPGDILLTDRVPSELPFVAGIIALEPATPNSHVAILAESYGIPFVHIAGAGADGLAAMVGQEIGLQAGGYNCTIEVTPLPAGFPAALRDDLRDRKIPPPLDLAAKETAGVLTAAASGLTPSDIRHFGGKASNFGLLRRVLPGNSPDPAIAVSFDLWDAFMAQPWGAGGTLGDAVATVLAGHSWPPADLDGLLDDLANVRAAVEDGTFTPGQRDEVLAALAGAGFDPAEKIRFRSSTNVEDSGQFIGAGLYDSFSGCMLDDLDDDDTGPSACDPNRENEQGVFRAIRKVFASFYNDNAYLERLRRGVDESAVGMALLVHHSYPDPTEAANGVATVGFNFTQFGTTVTGDIVTQLGAVSVTNPDGSAVPEVVEMDVYSGGGGTSFDLNPRQRSSLLPIAENHVMGWPGDYDALAQMLYDVGVAYRGLTGSGEFTLDFEFKLTAGPGGQLEVKQVREIPAPRADDGLPAVLLGGPVRLQVFQGEAGDIWANHRLKLLWDLESDSRTLDEPGLSTSWFSAPEGAWEQHVLEGALTTETGSPTTWPSPAHSYDGTHTTDSWTLPSAPAGAATRFTLEINPSTFGAPGPLRTLDDFFIHLFADYGRDVAPVAEFDDDASVDGVRLERWRDPDAPLPPRSILVERDAPGVEIRFYWPPPPTGIVAGYTAPLERWVDTTLTGFTTAPIVLRGYHSQTYRPGHHNFSEEFVFEPRLEPGINPTLIAELESADIRLIYVSLGIFGGPQVKVAGPDGKLRDWEGR